MARTKDYYAVLGIPRDAELTAIKRAYRRLVSHLQPDVGGEGAVEAIREVQAAFETLADAERRKRYDATLGAAGSDVSWPETRPLPPGVVRRRAASVAEILLTRAEARAGGRLPLRVPLTFDCPSCAGTGGYALPCLQCEGDGFLRQRVPCDLRLPPGVRTGAVFEVRLARPTPMTLLLTVTVLPH